MTLTLRELGEETELTMEQGTFATEKRLALRTAGWTDSLERLLDVVSSRP